MMTLSEFRKLTEGMDGDVELWMGFGGARSCFQLQALELETEARMQLVPGEDKRKLKQNQYLVLHTQLHTGGAEETYSVDGTNGC